MRKPLLLNGVMVSCVLFLFACARDLSQYQHLKEPKISVMENEKMLVVESKGDPNLVGGKAFSALFKTAFKLKSKVKGMKISAPRARWPNLPATPKNEWTGIYGLPIPATVETLPPVKDKSLPEVKIQTWDYGYVAEILHIGAWSEETPMIEKLHKFIKDEGYEIIGPHEEEYLKGPGMFFKGNPSKYQTIIRYRVKKTQIKKTQKVKK
ncbi:MAG TPA: hypothetical protein DHV62_01635 [Elusimicrobia bacterium]|nr:hypothetical protein [Elusimicrobiota bacterium]